MPQMDFFPQRPEVHPMIYAYRDLNPDYDGLLKVGYTEKDVDRRVAQQYPTKRPDGKLPYEILYRSSAMREDGSCFTDHDVHRMLRRRKVTGVGGEWFRCTVDELEAAVLAVKTDTLNEENHPHLFHAPGAGGGRQQDHRLFSFRQAGYAGPCAEIPLECQNALRQNLCHL